MLSKEKFCLLSFSSLALCLCTTLVSCLTLFEQSLLSGFFSAAILYASRAFLATTTTTKIESQLPLEMDGVGEEFGGADSHLFRLRERLESVPLPEVALLPVGLESDALLRVRHGFGHLVQL